MFSFQSVRHDARTFTASEQLNVLNEYLSGLNLVAWQLAIQLRTVLNCTAFKTCGAELETYLLKSTIAH